MSSTQTKTADLARDVRCTNDALEVDLVDGRTIIVPLAWYPRLQHGSAAERAQWELVGDGRGIHWPRLDEDLSVEGLLAGRPSSESQQSLAGWLENRRNAGPAAP